MVTKKYKDYHQNYEDLVVFNEEFRTAGEIDKLSLLSNRKDSVFHQSDFKRFEDGMSYEPKGKAWLNYPFAHYPNTKYTKITFQLSYYAWHFEKLTGRKCGRLFIDLIKPIKNSEGKVVDFINEVIPVMYIRNDIELLLNTFKPQIMNIVEPVKLYEF